MECTPTPPDGFNTKVAEWAVPESLDEATRSNKCSQTFEGPSLILQLQFRVRVEMLAFEQERPGFSADLFRH